MTDNEIFNPDASELKVLLWLGNQIPGGFFIYRADETQEIIYLNQAVLNIFGCANREEFDQLTGGTFRGLVHTDDFESIQESIDKQIEDSNNEKMDYVEYRIIRKDGEIRWIDDYGHRAALPGFGEVYYVFITDVTDKQRAREDKLRAELELVREKQQNEIKNDFLFNMSHDIRTPMNAIMGFSDMAKRHINEPKLAEEFLEKTITAGELMLTLLDDMLETNELESGKVKLHEEPTRLRDQITIVTGIIRLEAEKKQIEIREEIDLPDEKVLVDQNRFCRIIGNLLSNAVKFTDPGGSAVIHAEKKMDLSDDTALYIFRISDNGIGISPEFLPYIFSPFEREVSSTKTGTSGTGLGLSIVKSLLDLMGGSIRAESIKGRGSVFTVELPLKVFAAGSDPETAAPEPDPISMTPKRPYRILIVDDIEMNRELAEMILKEYGFLTETVIDGNYAVEAVKAHPAGYYDLILMDIQMPIMDGYEATRQIRAIDREDIPALPILAFSANAREEDHHKSLDSGMNTHIAKPFEITSLIQTINRYLSK